MTHNVFIDAEHEHLLQTILFMMIRLFFPVLVCYCLVQFSFRIGQKENEDEIFGGANLDMMHAKQSKITFADIAGIDQVKDEIKVWISTLSRSSYLCHRRLSPFSKTQKNSQIWVPNLQLGYSLSVLQAPAKPS